MCSAIIFQPSWIRSNRVPACSTVTNFIKRSHLSSHSEWICIRSRNGCGKSNSSGSHTKCSQNTYAFKHTQVVWNHSRSNMADISQKDHIKLTFFSSLSFLYIIIYILTSISWHIGMTPSHVIPAYTIYNSSNFKLFFICHLYPLLSFHCKKLTYFHDWTQAFVHFV